MGGPSELVALASGRKFGLAGGARVCSETTSTAGCVLCPEDGGVIGAENGLSLTMRWRALTSEYRERWRWVSKFR